MMKYYIFFLAILTVSFFMACTNKSEKPPVNLENKPANIEVKYTEDSGVKLIPVKLNGKEMDMIFDTGCSGISISLLEVQTLVKSKKISEHDVLGTSYSQIADGTIVENGEINLREVEIGGEDGIVLHNIKASVVLNQEAPLLIGNVVLDEVKSIELDNDKKVIRFYKR